MLGQVCYTIVILCASFVIGVFYQAKRCDCVTQQIVPAPMATATVQEYRSGNGHPVTF